MIAQHVLKEVAACVREFDLWHYLDPATRLALYDLGLADDRDAAAGVPGSQGGASPPTAESSTFPASAGRVWRPPAEAVAPGSTASGPGAAGVDPVLSMALRRIELLELGIVRALAILPAGAVASRLAELVPGRRVPTAREVLMPEWRGRRDAPLSPEQRAARRRALVDEATALLAESLELMVGGGSTLAEIYERLGIPIPVVSEDVVTASTDRWSDPPETASPGTRARDEAAAAATRLPGDPSSGPPVHFFFSPPPLRERHPMTSGSRHRGGEGDRP